MLRLGVPAVPFPWVVATMTAWTSLVGAEERGRTSHPVRFEADKLDVDPTRDELTLEGHVSVTVSRYWLGSEKLRLKRTPRGVLVDGSGRVAFCPCSSPPVSLGFESALVAPPTDLLLEQPTVRVGSVPVVWLPYLWLRSRDRPGLLPPLLAWRARDGFLAGAGAHVPFGRNARGFADVRAAGYLKGGVDVEARVESNTTSTRIRWDHLRDDLAQVDSKGLIAGRSRAVLAWSVDALRGPRVSSGPLQLEEVARRFDRFEATAGRSASFFTGGGGLRADAVRGGALDDLGTLGPELMLGMSGPLSSVGTLEATAALRTMHSPNERATTLGMHDGALDLAGTAGAFGVGFGLRSRGIAVVQDRRAGSMGAAGAQAFAELPLRKRFGNDLAHWVTPRLAGGAQWSSDTTQPIVPWLWRQGATINVSAEIDTTLGDYAGRQGASTVVRAGFAGQAEHPSAVAHWAAVAWTKYIAASLDAGVIDDSSPAVSGIARVRLGATDGINAHGHVAGQTRATTAPRLLNGGGWDSASLPWFDANGWSSAAGMQVPWTSWLATAVDGYFDHVRLQLLGVRGATGYRHPCGCLAILATAAQRMGRRGIDAAVTVDLVP